MGYIEFLNECKKRGITQILSLSTGLTVCFDDDIVEKRLSQEMWDFIDNGGLDNLPKNKYSRVDSLIVDYNTVQEV